MAVIAITSLGRAAAVTWNVTELSLVGNAHPPTDQGF